MRGKRVKIIRMIANETALASTLPTETQYDIDRHGVVTVSHCERAIIKQLKKISRVAKNMPARIFQRIAFAAID